MCALTKSVFSHSEAEKGFSCPLVPLASGETPSLRRYSHIFNFRLFKRYRKSILCIHFDVIWAEADGLELQLQHFSGEFLWDERALNTVFTVIIFKSMAWQVQHESVLKWVRKRRGRVETDQDVQLFVFWSFLFSVFSETECWRTKQTGHWEASTHKFNVR